MKTLTQYGAQLAPAANLWIPGLGSAVAGGMKAANSFLSKGESLAALRKSLFDQLGALDAPVVVLIDELDRVEDAEIRTVAQLVRSVADFPGISYAIAYDATRVIQALGGGVSSIEQSERGRSYLEKIVQVAFPLPVMFSEEILGLMNAELVGLSESLKLPKSFEDLARYKEVTALLIQNTVATPRDVKRLIGTFHVVCGMVGREADWTDLLVFSSLLGKAPRTLELVRQYPDRYVSNPVSQAEMMQMMIRTNGEPDKLEGLISADEDTPQVRALLAYLFPRFKDRSIDYPDALALRRPLLTTLRLGLVPGAVPRGVIEALVGSTEQEISAALRAAYDEDRLSPVIERLEGLYADIPEFDQTTLWMGISKFLEPEYPRKRPVVIMHTIADNFEAMFNSAAQRSPSLKAAAEQIFEALVGRNDLALLPGLIRNQLFVHGIYGNNERSSETILGKDKAKSIGERLVDQWYQDHLNGTLLPRTYDLHPAYMMMDAGKWDQACADRFTSSLSDQELFDQIITAMFGGIYGTGRSAIAKLCDGDAFAAAAEARLNAGNFDSAMIGVEAALKKYQRRLYD